MNDLIDSDLQIENMIYEIRGKQVMLDSDLAKLYQCKNGTKTINLAVKRNIDRFPEDFYFQLSLNEFRGILKFQIETSSQETPGIGGVRKLPYAFTEQGVAMLATVLKTEVAAQVSVNIMRAFVAMRKYISYDLVEKRFLEQQIIKNTEDIADNRKEIKLLQESFKKFEEKKVVNEIYFEGQIFDAYSKILDIFNEAKFEIIVVDGYADKEFLNIAKSLNIPVYLITKTKNASFPKLYSKYQKQYKNLKVYYNNSFHDRYFILDQWVVYHCGTSINHAGSKTFSINKIEDDVVKNSLIDEVNKII